MLALNSATQNPHSTLLAQNGVQTPPPQEPGVFSRLLGANDSPSDDKDAKIKTYELGAVEITAPQAVDANPTVTIVSKDDMDRQGALDVGEALRYTPGVFYMPVTNGYANTIYIRGFSENETGFYFDGIPINDTYAGNSSGDTDLFSFFAYGINEIQISKGYTSPAFSAGKMGGAINMVSSIPVRNLEFNTKYQFIANNEHRANLQLGRNFGDSYFQVTFSYLDRKSLNHSYDYSGLGPTPIKDSARSGYGFMGKYGWIFDDKHEYSVNFYHQHIKKASFPYYDKTALYALGDSKFNDFVSLNSKIWYHMNMNQSGTRTVAGYGYRSSSKYDDYTIGITEALKFDFTQEQNLKVGFLVKNDSHEATDWDADFAKRDWNVLNSSVFAEYALRINDLLRFVMSGSYDRHDGLSVKYTKYDKSISAKMPNKHLQGWTLQGILYFQPIESLIFHANVGHKTNLPKMRSLYYESAVMDSGSLSAESLINYELGVNFDNKFEGLGTSSFGATAYFNDIDNVIVTALVDSTTAGCIRAIEHIYSYNGEVYNGKCVIYDNARDGYSVGGEIYAKQGFFGDKFTLGANWSYIQRKTTVTRITVGDITANAKGERQYFTTHPRHNVNFTAQIAPRKEYDINFNGSFQTSRWAYDSTNDEYIELPDVFFMDVTANYYVTPRLKLSVGAYNLFDKNYNYENSNFNGALDGGFAGRRIFAGFEYNYAK